MTEGAVYERIKNWLLAQSLVPGGYLILGKVETLFGAARDRLALVDPRERVYRRPQ